MPPETLFIIRPLKFMSIVRLICLCLPIGLLLAACATPQPPSPDLSSGARRAIAAAETAGAQEHAPLELRFAREKLQAAQAAIAAEEWLAANQQLEQAEVDAELALSRTGAERARIKAETLRMEVRQLRQSIIDNFGLEALE